MMALATDIEQHQYKLYHYGNENKHNGARNVTGNGTGIRNGVGTGNGTVNETNTLDLINEKVAKSALSIFKIQHSFVEAILESGYEEVISEVVIKPYLCQYILFRESGAINICSMCLL